ncbi:unnamed protein product [Urochloa decumbens]|uniref:Uncharacterized protein n=1 Tax=Urochloa decumbens TaxID=240449 RepID=A0ABC9ALR2_9POAL
MASPSPVRVLSRLMVTPSPPPRQRELIPLTPWDLSMLDGDYISKGLLFAAPPSSWTTFTPPSPTLTCWPSTTPSPASSPPPITVTARAASSAALSPSTATGREGQGDEIVAEGVSIADILAPPGAGDVPRTPATRAARRAAFRSTGGGGVSGGGAHRRGHPGVRGGVAGGAGGVAAKAANGCRRRGGGLVASSPRFDVYGCDFGSGRPLAVRTGRANKFDGDVWLFPRREGGGSVKVEVALAPEDMAALEDDDELWAAVSAGAGTLDR